ncbi:MAG: ABC transporter permease [Ardenticatenales bacterium]
MNAAIVRRVALREFLWHLRRRSFLLTTFGLPVLGLAFGLATAYFGAGAAVQVGAVVGRALEVDELRRSAERPRIALVESARGDAAAPGDVSPGDAANGGGSPVAPGIDPSAPSDDHAAASVTTFPSLAAARAALDAGDVDSIYVVGADYPNDPTIVRLARSWAPPGGDVDAVTDALRHRVWPDAPADTAAAMADPSARIARHAVPPPAPVAQEAAAADGADKPARIALVLAVGLLLYTTIFTASSFLLQSVTTEKENRIIEILLTSLTPLELLVGKVIGLGLLGGVQLVVWGGFGLIALNVGAVALAAATAVHFGPVVIGLAIAYFVFGYLFYASLMGAIGALVPSFQESGPLTFVLLIPAWSPFLVLDVLMRAPNGWLARAMSVFPPTAPLCMMLRLTSGVVPWYDIALSLGLLVVGAAAVLALAARLFGTTQLLAGEGFRLRRGLAVLFGR